MNAQDYQSGGALISMPYGEQKATKLTEAEALEIYQRKAFAKSVRDEARRLSMPALADKFGLHRETIRRLASDKCVSKPYRDRTMGDVELIRQAIAERDRLLALAAQHTSPRIAADFGVSVSMVDGIYEGRKWVRLATC